MMTAEEGSTLTALDLLFGPGAFRPADGDGVKRAGRTG